MFEDGLVGDAKFSKFSNGSLSIGLERSIYLKLTMTEV